MARALAAAIVVSLLAASGAGGAHEQPTPKRGGTVVVGPLESFGIPRCLNPLMSCGTGFALNWITEKVLMPAYSVAPDGTPRPKLVTRVEYTRKPPFTLTYHIRPEARWSDGPPITAADFVFTYSAIRRNLSDAPESEEIRRVDPLDRKTVRVVLRSRYAGWRGLFSIVLPQHALAGEDLSRVWFDEIDNPKTAKAIGSGPFLLESMDRDRQITLVRNPRYWGAHTAFLDRLVLRFSADLSEAIARGEVDVGLSRNTSIVPQLRRTPGINVRAIASDGWEHLDLRVAEGGHPALQDKPVRRALAYGIDRTAIVRRFFADADPESWLSDSAAFRNTSRHYQPNWSRYRYRPGLARRLLEQAGCRMGSDGVYSCRGLPLSLVFYAPSGAGLRALVLEFIQRQLREVGIEVRPMFAPGTILFEQILPGHRFDAVMYLSTPRGDPLASKDVYGCRAADNLTGYCQRLVTEDLDQADRILDARQRGRVLNRVDKRMAKDVPVIPLYQNPFVLASRKAVRNIVTAPTNVLWNAENWWLER